MAAQLIPAADRQISEKRALVCWSKYEQGRIVEWDICLMRNKPAASSDKIDKSPAPVENP
jgi:hypothetical protein